MRGIKAFYKNNFISDRNNMKSILSLPSFLILCLKPQSKQKMHFSSFGTTINSNLIVRAITCHGIPVFHTSEMLLKPFISRDSACNLADIIAVYKQFERFMSWVLKLKNGANSCIQK